MEGYRGMGCIACGLGELGTHAKGLVCKYATGILDSCLQWQVMEAGAHFIKYAVVVQNTQQVVHDICWQPFEDVYERLQTGR